MKLLAYFDAFLKDTVNLNQTRLGQLDDRVRAITSTFKNDTSIGDLYEDHSPQGSWAHRTIIKPLNNHEFDADILLQLREVENWEPKDYLREVRAAFKRSATYRSKVTKKNRCCRIVYAGDCHVDVVPYIVLGDGSESIVNYAENEFEETNPQGFTDWMKEKDDLANGNLRRVIRLLKYVRDYKQTFSVPSVILTTMLGERVQAWDTDSRYSDTPTALKTLLTDLSNWLDLHPLMPPLPDPSCPQTTFNHRWDQAQYENFRNKVKIYCDWVAEAYDAADKAVSLSAWQRVFGTSFQKPAVVEKSLSASSRLRPEREARAPQEQYIEELGFTWKGGYGLLINARVLPRNGFRDGPLRRLRNVRTAQDLEFSITTDVPEPFDLYWKVRNRGSEAAVHGQLRGNIIRDENRTRKRREPTRWRGCHYVEAYIVKNGFVLATDHHDVPII
ncbi:cyclic GMP-AMP synthase DncV-like nucleotidyltransferase [Streptomyces sp. NPDC047981]|uniref:SMODS domain-containing nucleotidyltransferase n=1 Tax=Streptomyces sp. NPDC047981 TaxID=3154610 RepID=UPI003441EE95